MSNKQNVFVCVGLSYDYNIISKVIEAETIEDASIIYEKNYNIKPQNILGPFTKKRSQVSEVTSVIKFSSDKFSKAIYNDWAVNAFVLDDPINHAYLVFTHHLYNKKQAIPKGTVVVPISQLRFINNE